MLNVKFKVNEGCVRSCQEGQLASSSSSSSCDRHRCLSPSSAPPGCHRASGIGSGHMSRLRALRSWQCCSGCSAAMMSALHGHISDWPTLNLLYMLALSLLCPVLSLNRMTCSGLFSLWRLSDWLESGCCHFHFSLEQLADLPPSNTVELGHV